MAIEDTAGERSDPLAIAGPRPTWRRPFLIHRGSQAVSIACIGLALVMIQRYHQAQTAPGGPPNELFVVLILTALTGVMAAAVAHFRPEQGRTRSKLATSATGSVALVLALALVWAHINLAQRDVRLETEVGRAMLSQAEVDAYLAAHRGPTSAADPLPYRIPTGVLLESVEFLSSNNVRISGFVWQKWPAGVPTDITRGVELPEAIDTGSLDDPAYRVTENDGSELIGWHVRATLRQAFDYHRYPFDRQDIWLRMWPRDFGRRVMLVPDFASYPNTAPSALPGVDLKFVYGGWTPEHAHFSYGDTRYDATMGYADARAAAAYPALYFNVGLKREFLEPFLDYVIFALAVAILLFAVLVLSMNQEASGGRSGLSSFSILGLTGTLLFAVILREFQLRSILDPDQIVYLETLPFLLNVAILLVALHAIMLSEPVRQQSERLGYRGSLLPVLLYWPALLGVLLAVTLIVFYR